MELIDIGANLVSNQFRRDLDQVVARATEAGIARMVVTGTDAKVSREAAQLAASREGLVSTAGVHPHHASEWTPDLQAELNALAATPQVVAIGECGLDFNRNFSTPEDQRRAFQGQLAAAVETGLPLFLHERDAHADFLAMLREVWPSLSAGAVVHCFTGGPQQAEAYLELGAHLGVTGWVCDERRGSDLRAAVPLIPDERLLLETDAPYLLPRSIQPRPKSRRNEPSNLVHVAQAVAELRGTALEPLSVLTSANARSFFQLT